MKRKQSCSEKAARTGPRISSRKNGQALVEYALILVLVALAVIVGAFLIGQAAQRVYGVIVGALGGAHNAEGQHEIAIDVAMCAASISQNRTGMWVTGTTNEDVNNLLASTNQSVGTGIGGAAAPVESTGGNTFRWNPLLANTADVNLCPQSVVIQSADGAIAVAPLDRVTVP